MKQISEELLERITDYISEVEGCGIYMSEEYKDIENKLDNLPDTFYTQAIKHREKLNFTDTFNDIKDKLSEECKELKDECDNIVKMKDLLDEAVDVFILISALFNTVERDYSINIQSLIDNKMYKNTIKYGGVK